MSLQTPLPETGVAAWRGRDVVRVALWWVGLTVVIVAGHTVAATLRGATVDPHAGYLATTAGHVVRAVLRAVAALAAVWVVARRNGSPLRAVGLRKPSTRWVLLTSIIGAVISVDRLLVALVAGALTTPGISDLPAHLDPAATTTGWLWVNVALVGLVTPVQEEILHRGVVFGWLRHRTGKAPAILASAAIFAAFHAPLGAANVTLAAVSGVVLAWMYERSGSLLPGIVLHATWNTASLLAAFLIAAG